jgi:hypothetical protein
MTGEPGRSGAYEKGEGRREREEKRAAGVFGPERRAGRQPSWAARAERSERWVGEDFLFFKTFSFKTLSKFKHFSNFKNFKLYSKFLKLILKTFKTSHKQT